jgi:hypothetical protein
MELNTQAGRDAIASFADRLVQENVNLDNRLMELSIATGTHMHTIEETFKRADVCMEELKAAGQAASTAAAHAMASSIGASSSGGTSPGITRTDQSLLKGHMDEAAATQLNVSMALEERISNVEDRAVAQQLASDNAVMEATNLSLAAHHAVHELEGKHAAAESVLRAQIQEAVLTLEESQKGNACMCPQGCSGRVVVPPICLKALLSRQARTRPAPATRSKKAVTLGGQHAAPTDLTRRFTEAEAVDLLAVGAADLPEEIAAAMVEAQTSTASVQTPELTMPPSRSSPKHRRILSTRRTRRITFLATTAERSESIGERW